MSDKLSPEARRLLDDATSLGVAAEQIKQGQSAFGRWLVPALVPAQGLVVLYGPTGVGKSFFTAHLGVCVAGGRQWGDHQLEVGTVVYLAPEDRSGIEA